MILLFECGRLVATTMLRSISSLHGTRDYRVRPEFRAKGLNQFNVASTEAPSLIALVTTAGSRPSPAIRKAPPFIT